MKLLESGNQWVPQFSSERPKRIGDSHSQTRRDQKVLSGVGGFPQGKIYRPKAALKITFADGRTVIREYATIEAMCQGRRAIEGNLKRFKQAVLSSARGAYDPNPSYKPPKVQAFTATETRTKCGDIHITMKPGRRASVTVTYQDNYVCRN
jgi:hypothetical protein